MSTKQLTEGKGTIFPSKKKAGPKSPDWYGEIMINGQVHKLGGWHKKGEGQYGTWELISLSVDTYGQQNKQSYPRDVTPYKDSDIPF